LSQPRHLAQGSKICIINKSPIACHVDGEPWEQMMGQISISFDQKVDFLVPAPSQLNTDVLAGVLRWAVATGKITDTAHKDITRELSHRADARSNHY
jgi:hypothetical protein